MRQIITIAHDFVKFQESLLLVFGHRYDVMLASSLSLETTNKTGGNPTMRQGFNNSKPTSHSSGTTAFDRRTSLAWAVF